MLPFAMMGIQLNTREGILRVSVWEISVDMVVFRLSRCHDTEKITDADYVRIRISQPGRESAYLDLPEQGDYRIFEIGPEDAPLMDQVRYYRMEVESSAFSEQVRDLFVGYTRYVRGKQEGDDAALAKAMTGYPAEREAMMPKSFREQKERWYREASERCDLTWQEAVAGIAHIGVILDRPELWERYLREGRASLLRSYWQENRMETHPLASLSIDRIYIGNEGCAILFPPEEQLLHLLERCESDGILPGIILSPATESLREQQLERAQLVIRYCRVKGTRAEIRVNDWGMWMVLKEELIGEEDRIRLVQGTCLVKYRKDPRMPWVSNPSANSRIPAGYPVSASMDPWVLEPAGYPIEPGLEGGSRYLQIPFYTMNMAGHCTLYAVCANGSRGRQTPVTDCPGYCRDRAFLYPEFLHMAGIGKELIGYDDRILWDGEYMKKWIDSGVEVLLVNLR